MSTINYVNLSQIKNYCVDHPEPSNMNFRYIENLTCEDDVMEQTSSFYGASYT
jgi:hypothetical protein